MRFKDCIREVFGLFLAVGLCIFLHPYILALMLSLALRCPTDSNVIKYNICMVMEVLSMALTAFIMGLITSWFWKKREVRGSLIASILFGSYNVGLYVYSAILAMAYLDSDIMSFFRAPLILPFFGGLVMLFLFSFLAGKLVKRIRCLKSRSI